MHELVRSHSGIWIKFVVELYALLFQLALRYFQHEMINIVIEQGSGRGQLLRSKAEMLTDLHDELTVLKRARENITNMVTVLGEDWMTVSSIHFVLGIRATNANEKEKGGQGAANVELRHEDAPLVLRAEHLDPRSRSASPYTTAMGSGYAASA